ncbi:cGMP-dependent 3',5'-cyclic phosphodiesterase-like protein [Sarcoptes scabiei]|uniref:3',5'-cyclic-GMP phosphodiesterase n=1 Tax=Sarcoptes scabiei TaxID=52283 RepID=A0A131ZTW4_SARSC|nr:cGMP-dependent 3',5'-cyclic phosphodiesterase-like protein [Sarcoptes scabiei]
MLSVISAHEFEATGGGYLRPMVTTTNDGTLTFLPVQNRPKTSQQDGVSALSSDHLKYHRSLSNELKNGTHLNRCTQRSHSPFRSAVSDTSQKLFTESSDINKKENDPNHIHHHHHHYHNHPHLASKSHPLVSIKSKEELKSILDERELIFELVKDICNDLDVKSLCHKILKNVSILINADRCSLFLVRGEKNDPDNCYLVSQLFDVDQQSTIEQVSRNGEIIIPWGTGIVGHVAESGIPANIPDCYQDSRFSDIIDHKTGYKTHDMLCNPIFDIDGEVIGVAQVINKKNSDSFDSNDENVFYKYLQFCGIGLRNAQIYERSQLENKRNQVLLDLAQMIFEKQSNIENIIYRILIHILSLLQCERCQIMLLVDDSDDPSLFYYGRSYQDPYADLNIEPNELNRSLLSQIDCGNISDSNSSCSSCNASTTSESLCDLSIGVSTNQKISPNRTTSFYRVFDLQSADMEQSDFEKTRFTPFEGRFPINIGITGYVATSGETLNIPDAYKDNRFDPSVDQDQDFRHQSILCMPIRNASRKIIGVAQLVNKLNKRPFNKNDENLFEAFAIFSGMGIENTQMFERAVKAMAKQKVTLELLSYHASANDQEASKFARMLIPSTSSLSLSSLRFDDFSLNEDQMIKACIRMFIDLDLIERFHIDYKVLCKWILTVRKNYRPVLYHNWRHAFNVAQMMFAIFVNTDMCLILGELETLSLIVACLCHDLDHLVYVLEEAILATDLAVYFRKRDQFIDIVDLKNFDWSIEQHRSLLRSMLMTCCDIAAITKPWHIQKVVAELVASEFYQQGDIEKKQLNIEPIDMMNRDKKNELPRMQMSFIDSICLPIYQTFAKLCPLQMKILLNGVLANREAWNLLSNEPYRLNLRHPSTRNCDPSNKETSKQTKSIETIEDNQCAE